MGRLWLPLTTAVSRTTLTARLARMLVTATGSPDFDEFLRCRLHVGGRLERWRRPRDITGETLSLRADQGRHHFRSRGCACNRLVERSRSCFSLRCRDGRCICGS